MRVRSWMAALALVVGTSIAVGRAMPALVTNQVAEKAKTDGAEKSKPQSESPAPKPAATRLQSVQLSLVVAGLGAKGCEVQVKPGNASCKFSTVYAKRGDKPSSSSPPMARAVSSFATSSFAVPTARSRSPSRSGNRARPPKRFTAVSGSPRNPR